MTNEPPAVSSSEREQAIQALIVERDAMRRTFAWLLGEEGDFPPPPEFERGKPMRLYWWRGALRERWEAAVALGPDRFGSEVCAALSSGEVAPADERAIDAMLDDFDEAVRERMRYLGRGRSHVGDDRDTTADVEKYREKLRARLLARPSLEEPAPTVGQEAPAAWAIIEDGAVVGLRIAKSDADYAAQAWNRPPLVAPLFLRSALSGGIPRTDSDPEQAACATCGLPKREHRMGYGAHRCSFVARHVALSVPSSVISSESTISDEAAELADIVGRCNALADGRYPQGVWYRMSSKDSFRLIGAKIQAIIDRLQRVPSPKGSEEAAYDWEGSYTMLRDALEEHLGAFIGDGEESEEYLYVRGIERIATHLAYVTAKAFGGGSPRSVSEQSPESNWLMESLRCCEEEAAKLPQGAKDINAAHDAQYGGGG